MFPGPRFGGGALAVYLDGEPVVDVWTGWSDRRGATHWTADTGAMVFSATKGMASTVIHRLVDRGLIDYDAPVAEYWPEFGANGKATITVREVMRHRAGLSHLQRRQQGRPAGPLVMEERLAAAPVNRVLLRQARLPRADLRLADVRAGPCGHRQGHARSDPHGAGRAAQHRRPAPGPAARRGADAGRADHHPAGQSAELGARFRRAEAGRTAVVGRSRRAVLPGDGLRRTGRYPVPGRRDTRGQRSRHGTRAGEDVRGARHVRAESTAPSSCPPSWRPA